MKKLITKDTVIITTSNNIINLKKQFSDFINYEVEILTFNNVIKKMYKKNNHKVMNQSIKRLISYKLLKNNYNLLSKFKTSIVDDLLSINDLKYNFNLEINRNLNKKGDELKKFLNEYKIFDEAVDELEILNAFLNDNNTDRIEKNIIFTNINYFKPLERQIIKKICEISDEVHFIIPSKKIIENNELLNETYNFLQKIEKNIKFVENDSNNLELILNLNLENHKLEKNTNISLYKSTDLFNEIEFTAHQIIKEIRKNNYNYNDIAVICNKIEDYEHYIDFIFSTSKIPFDRKINYKLPIIEFIVDLFSGKQNFNHSFFDIKLNEQDLINQIANLKACLTYNEFIKKLYFFLEKLNINNDYFNDFLKLLEDILFVYKNDKFELPEFIDILQLFVQDKTKINYSNSVFIGNLEEVIDSNYKLIFLIGSNETILKPTDNNFNSFSVKDLKQYFTNYDSTFKTKYFDYLIVNLLSKKTKLIITYHKINDDLMTTDEAYLVKVFKDSYLNLNIHSNSLDNFSYIRSLFFSRLNSDNELLTYLKDFSEYKTIINLKKYIQEFYNPQNIKYEKNKIYLSPSKVDTYNTCNFKYFIQHILKLNKEETKTYDSRIIGIYVHFLLEKLVNDINQKKDIKIYEIEFLSQSNFNKTHIYLIQRITKNIEKIWQYIKNEIDSNKFNPKYTEVDISKSLELCPLILNVNNIEIIMNGIIDRIDYSDNYYRIVDYKTGDKKINYNHFLEGLNLQLLIYLLYLDHNIKDKSFGGVFYNKALIKYEKNKIIDEYKLEGIMAGDENLIDDLGGENITDYLNSHSRNKFKKEVKLSDNDINILKEYTEKIIKQTAIKINSGCIKINPFKELNACDYCPYSSICGNDTKSKLYRKINAYAFEDVLYKMKEGLDELD